MGTSKDYAGQTGGGWTRTKRIASRISREGPRRELIRDYGEAIVGALGGAAAAAESAAAARRVGAAFSGFLGDVGRAGLETALGDLGMAEAVGRPTTELVAMLLERLSGSGDTLEEVAARQALLDCLEELVGDSATYAVLADMTVTEAEIAAWIALFVGRSVYYRTLPLLESRLNEATATDRNAAEAELRDWAEAAAAAALRDVPLAGLDPGGADIAQMVADLVQRAYAIFGGAES